MTILLGSLALLFLSESITAVWTLFILCWPLLVILFLFVNI